MTESVGQSDEQIATQVQKGNGEAFGILMQRYEAKLLRYAARFLLTNDRAEDVVQEVFIKAYTHINGFDTRRKFSSWIYRIAHNEYINTIKKRRYEAFLFFDPDNLFPHPRSKQQADDLVNEAEIKHMIEQGLDKLSPKYREPIVLYYIEELDYKEIADVLQIPIATVGVRLSRGKRLMKKYLQEGDSHE